MTIDDQITVLPLDWTYRGDSFDEEVTVRPLDPDPENQAKFTILCRQYGEPAVSGLAQDEIVERLVDVQADIANLSHLVKTALDDRA